jgi:ribosomal protein S6--L-glutamate ligase
MILSFHPCYVADENRICAERPPGEADLDRIRAAAAVVLPQGCKPELYTLAREHAAHVFPNYEARFDYPGKTGQIRLFQELQVPHPTTRLYRTPGAVLAPGEAAHIATEIGYPLVFKLDFGGEGDTVARIEDPHHLHNHVKTVTTQYQGPCLVQAYIPAGQRSLRVVVIGRRLISYWRINTSEDRFGTSAGKGARIDHEADPHLQHLAREATRDFCHHSKINLAGFDLLFTSSATRPLFLEINHYFGRRGLGGSDAFYAVLTAEIDHWLARLPLDHRS